MQNSLFYNHIETKPNNNNIIQAFEEFAQKHPNQQIYLLNAPLGDKYTYGYQENAIVILSPKHKFIFLDLAGDKNAFEEYYDDFIEDLSALSDKYKYKEYIGRSRDWKQKITTKETYNTEFNISDILERNALNKPDQRISELLISLMIGSINDIEKVGAQVPESILDRVKRNIILFDGDQTRFIYQKFANKSVSIQGLSGTGKTELLLHKLKDLYLSNENNKIFFSCHNIALANSLKKRIPNFFNFMKVEKQIEWNSKLWVDRAWGSQKDKNSGLYSYICSFYGIPFLPFGKNTTYITIFTQALQHINLIDEKEFEFAFDYILIDERQDFPKVFLELCEKITRKKVYIAGDIFQDIFENTKETELDVDVILNRCYRTDPRTLMFAHAIGMKLFEPQKLNWFEDTYWDAIGYKINRTNGSREVTLSRDPIRRFEDLELEKFESVIIKQTTEVESVIKILNSIQEQHPTVQPNDIAIIVLDDNRQIYNYIDALCTNISKKLGWKINRAYETKNKVDDALFVSNPNNVKGLEFPFVLCLTGAIKDAYRYRNILYTMLTRSFIQSYLLVQTPEGVDVFTKGLISINKDRLIKTIEPTEQEKDAIKNTLLKLQNKGNISYKDFLEQIFNDLKIKANCREKFEKALMQTEIEEFDREKTVKFIKANKEFYCE